MTRTTNPYCKGCKKRFLKVFKSEMPVNERIRLLRRKKGKNKLEESNRRHNLRQIEELLLILLART